MSDIHNSISKNFNDNILYFELNHPDVYKKLSNLDSAVANNHYKEKYALVHEDDNFDVLEISTQKYLYSKKSILHANKSSNSIDFSTNSNLFQGYTKHKFTKKEIQEIEHKSLDSSHLPSIYKIITYINNNISRDKELKSLDKFIFFGVGLGLHIQSIHEKIKSKVYLIIENDLELFRLSLFTINYKDLAEDAELFFSVFNDDDTSHEIYNSFLEKNYYDNHHIKFFHLLSHSNKTIDKFLISLNSQPHLTFLFHDLYKQYMHPLNYLFNGYKFLNKNVDFNNSKFKDIPFLILAMGPSLEKNIKWLKYNHKKFITIAVSSSLVYLEANNIKPNIIIHTDPFEIGEILFKKLKNIDFIKDSISLFSTATPYNIVSLVDQKNLYLFETGTSYKVESLKLSSPCVGSLSYQLLLILDIKKIYLLGLDLAVSHDTNSTHSSSHVFNKTINHDNDTVTYTNTLVQTNGNFVSKVETTPHFNESIKSIKYFVPKLIDKEQKVFNLNNGAKIEGSLPTFTKSLKLQPHSINNIQKELNKFFYTNSQSILTTEEKQKMYSKIDNAKLIQKYIKDSCDVHDITNYTNIIHKVKSYELTKILDTYLKYILSYIVDFMNAKNTSISSHEKELTSLLNTELSNIINLYIYKLEKKLS